MPKVKLSSNLQIEGKYNQISIVLFIIWLGLIIYGSIIIYLLLKTGNGFFIFLVLFWNAFSYISYIFMYYPTNSIVDTLFYFIDSKKWEGNPEFVKDIIAQILEALIAAIISLLVFGSSRLFIHFIIEMLSVMSILIIFITIFNVLMNILEITIEGLKKF
ncbi:MAG: hypothetical protein ACTSR8_21415 [Promethearchaeota archaeon]